MTCCALCDTPISHDNDSREHIIPNAIGGRKTVRRFICKQCNSNTGQTWDNELCTQLKPICTLLNIQRQRGHVQPLQVETVKGEGFIMHADGKLNLSKTLFSEKHSGDRTEINIGAKSWKELRKLLPGLTRKYPQLDIEQLLEKATPREEYIEDPLHIPLTFGGDVAGRSLVKSCLALASQTGLTIDSCEHARDYLLADGEMCFGYYNETDFIQNRPPKTFLHCVLVRGDPASRQVLGYVEYFGVLRVVLCLSNNYHGKPLTCCYAIDPITGQELDIQSDLRLTSEEIAAAYRREKLDYSKVEAALSDLIEYYMERSIDGAISKATADAVEYAFANCGAQPGEKLSDQHRAIIGRLLIERLEPLLVHLLSRTSFTEEDIKNIEANINRTP